MLERVQKGFSPPSCPRICLPRLLAGGQRWCLCRLPSLAWKCLPCQKFPGHPDPRPVHPDLSYLGSLKTGERPPRERDGRERCQWAPSTDEVLGSSLANIVYLGPVQCSVLRMQTSKAFPSSVNKTARLHSQGRLYSGKSPRRWVAGLDAPLSLCDLGKASFPCWAVKYEIG